MQQQRVHENDVACLGRVLQHLQWDAVDILDALVEPRDAGSRVAGGAEVSKVGIFTPFGGASGPV